MVKFISPQEASFRSPQQVNSVCSNGSSSKSFFHLKISQIKVTQATILPFYYLLGLSLSTRLVAKASSDKSPLKVSSPYPESYETVKKVVMAVALFLAFLYTLDAIDRRISKRKA